MTKKYRPLKPVNNNQGFIVGLRAVAAKELDAAEDLVSGAGRRQGADAPTRVVREAR